MCGSTNFWTKWWPLTYLFCLADGSSTLEYLGKSRRSRSYWHTRKTASTVRVTKKSRPCNKEIDLKRRHEILRMLEFFFGCKGVWFPSFLEIHFLRKSVLILYTACTHFGCEWSNQIYRFPACIFRSYQRRRRTLFLGCVTVIDSQSDKGIGHLQLHSSH